MLYQINKRKIESSKRVPAFGTGEFGLSEGHIEEFLASNINAAISEENLFVIYRQIKGREDADILALDQEGDLYIFELKKGKSNPENLLQVFRYGQKFGQYSYEELDELVREELTKNPSQFEQLQEKRSLKKLHQTYFELSKPLSKEEFNNVQFLILITNGVDMKTIAAINYWSQMGVNIETSPYHLYEINGEIYIQFNTYDPKGNVAEGENFIVNTCGSHWEEMLGNGSEGKAAAYYGNKTKISNNLSKGSVVYLYHTGAGVIAKGKATSDFKKAKHDGKKDEEYNVPLEFDWALVNVDDDDWDKVVRPSEINKECEMSHRFRGTLFSISEDIAKAIDKIAKKKMKEARK